MTTRDYILVGMMGLLVGVTLANITGLRSKFKELKAELHAAQAHAERSDSLRLEQLGKILDWQQATAEQLSEFIDTVERNDSLMAMLSKDFTTYKNYLYDIRRQMKQVVNQFPEIE